MNPKPREMRHSNHSLRDSSKRLQSLQEASGRQSQSGSDRSRNPSGDQQTWCRRVEKDHFVTEERVERVREDEGEQRDVVAMERSGLRLTQADVESDESSEIPPRTRDPVCVSARSNSPFAGPRFFCIDFELIGVICR